MYNFFIANISTTEGYYDSAPLLKDEASQFDQDEFGNEGTTCCSLSKCIPLTAKLLSNGNKLKIIAI